MEGAKEADFPDIAELAQEIQPADRTGLLKAEPLMEPKLFRRVCELLQQLVAGKQVLKGVNQVLKAVGKSGVEFVVLAADCDPLEIVMTLPPECEARHIPFCFVPSKAVLGRACGIKRPVVAAAVVSKEASPYTAQILDVRDRIEQLLV